MKQTAVEWLIGRFHYEGFIGTYCSEEEIKSKRQIMIEIINQAKEMEREQIVKAYDKGEFNCGVNETSEQYYVKTYKSK